MLPGTKHSNAGPLRKRWYLDFSSANAEKSLVPLRFAPSESEPKWNVLFLATFQTSFATSYYCLKKE